MQWMKCGFSALSFWLILIGNISPQCLHAQDVVQPPRYDVVPPSWIAHSAQPDQDRSAAYVFPSVVGSFSVPRVDFSLPDFFRTENRFHAGKPFSWKADRAGSVTITVTRSRREARVDIGVSEDSMAVIRRFDWEHFQELQEKFRGWLCRHSRSWLFGDCESQFQHLDQDLTTIWKDHVLADATFKSFAKTYLNTAVPQPIAYAGNWKTLGEKTSPMFATRIVPGQTLAISWGNDNLYPAADGIRASYSRITVGGQTELQVVDDNGMRLFPAGSCKMAGQSQKDEASPKDGLLPFPKEWAAVLTQTFIPIYNLFDLHNSRLLAVGKVKEPEGKEASGDKKASEADALPACFDNTRTAPRYLFLLVPRTYLKPDSPTPASAAITRFENEARLRPPVAARDEISMLERQFFIVGCGVSDQETPDDAWKNLADEWNHLLEQTFAVTPTLPHDPPDPPVTSSPCGSFISGLFAGKSFVELRHHFSINGRPLQSGALNLETVGQALSGSFAAHLNRIRAPEAAPLLEILRSFAGRSNGSLAPVVRIRFYTSMSQVLDQAHVFEGDEIYVGSISEDLR